MFDEPTTLAVPQPEMVPEQKAAAGKPKPKRRRPRPTPSGGKYATASPTTECEAAEQLSEFPAPPPATVPFPAATATPDDNVLPSPLPLPSPPAASTWAADAAEPTPGAKTLLSAATSAASAAAPETGESASEHDRLRLQLEGEEDDDAHCDAHGDDEESDGAGLPASPILVEVAALDGEEELLGALILECTVPPADPIDALSPSSSSSFPSSSSSSSSSMPRSRGRSFTVVHEGRFYEVQTPDDAVPGEVINVVVMLPAAPRSQGSQRRLFESHSGRSRHAPPSAVSSASSSSSSVGNGATPSCHGIASAAPFAASRVCSPTSASASTGFTGSISGSGSGSGSISTASAPLAALVLSQILDIVAAVNRRFKLAAKLGAAQGAALEGLRALNAKTRSAADGLTLYDRVEALLSLCVRRLGTLVSVAVQVERELAVGQWVSRRARGLQGRVEPLFGAALRRLRALDEAMLGGAAGAAASRVLPARLLRSLPGCGLEEEEDEEEEEGREGEGEGEGVLRERAAQTPQLTRVQAGASGGGSGGSSGGRSATARLVQTPIRALRFSPPSK